MFGLRQESMEGLRRDKVGRMILSAGSLKMALSGYWVSRDPMIQAWKLESTYRWNSDEILVMI